MNVRIIAREVLSAMDAAHSDWSSGLTRDYSGALIRRVWEAGFRHPRIYPRAHFRQSVDAEAIAQDALHHRDAEFWETRQEHSTLKEFQFDVSWAEYEEEYRADEAPRFRCLRLALESELSGKEWEVVYDLQKLLCTKADLRVLVWYPKRFPGGVENVRNRIESAREWDAGNWLLSAWDDDGFTHAANFSIDG